MNEQQEVQGKGRGNTFRLFVIAISLIFGYSTGAWDVWLTLMLIVCLFSSWVESKVEYTVTPALDARNPRMQAVYEDEITDEDDNILSSQNDEVLTTVPEPVPNQYEVPPEPPTKHDIITWLAQQRNDNGTYTYSANKIADFFGGTRADVLSVIRDVRNDDTPHPPDTYQVRTTMRANSTQDEVVYFLDNGRAVRKNKWGVEYVIDGNKEMPVELYVSTLK